MIKISKINFFILSILLTTFLIEPRCKFRRCKKIFPISQAKQTPLFLSKIYSQDSFNLGTKSHNVGVDSIRKDNKDSHKIIEKISNIDPIFKKSPQNTDMKETKSKSKDSHLTNISSLPEIDKSSNNKFIKIEKGDYKLNNEKNFEKDAETKSIINSKSNFFKIPNLLKISTISVDDKSLVNKTNNIQKAKNKEKVLRRRCRIWSKYNSVEKPNLIKNTNVFIDNSTIGNTKNIEMPKIIIEDSVKNYINNSKNESIKQTKSLKRSSVLTVGESQKKLKYDDGNFNRQDHCINCGSKLSLVNYEFLIILIVIVLS